MFHVAAAYCGNRQDIVAWAIMQRWRTVPKSKAFGVWTKDRRRPRLCLL